MNVLFLSDRRRRENPKANNSEQGIGDKIDFYAPAAERADGTPAKPDTTVVDVDLMACIYGTYLALHYMRKNPNKKGKIVYTSSMCGLYSGDMIPLYTAAKHGVSWSLSVLSGTTEYVAHTNRRSLA
jgi:NAD(P)-dependent dehydrogenase (short-subunit alcohol dehydrogenase family)